MQSLVEYIDVFYNRVRRLEVDMAEKMSNDSGESAEALATSADLISAGVEYRASEAPRRWLSVTLTSLMLTCFAVSGWLWLQPLMRTQEAQAVSVDAIRLPRENAPPRVTRELVSIEDVQLGRRVVGRNPLREQTQLPSDNHPETHRTIRLEMIQYGTLYELAFVRSLTWLSEQQAQVGGMIQLVMTEMGLDGPARVISIEPCPEIEPDDGTGRMVVTGTMKHLAGNVLEIQTAGDTERLGVTDTHPIWSVDRQDFVVAGQLTVGESLEQADGTVTQITRITPTRGPPVMVYNLEIDAEHVFHVGEDGVLVHNSCPDAEALFNPLLRTKANSTQQKITELFERNKWLEKRLNQARNQLDELKSDLPTNAVDAMGFDTFKQARIQNLMEAIESMEREVVRGQRLIDELL